MISVSVARLSGEPSSLTFRTAGRIRKGPAPVSLSGLPYVVHFFTKFGLQLNLEVPQYDFNDAEGKLIIG